MSKKKHGKPSKEKTVENGVDSRLSKLSMTELIARRDEAAKSLQVIEEFIEGKKTERANELMAELKALGLNPRLGNEVKAPKADKQVRTKKDEPCKVCGFKTTPIHDSRAHRSQNPKKAFTTEELKARNLHKASQ